MTVFNARALGSLVAVAGNALSKLSNVILNAVVKVLEGQPDDELKAAMKLSVHFWGPKGLNTHMMMLSGW